MPVLTDSRLLHLEAPPPDLDAESNEQRTTDNLQQASPKFQHHLIHIAPAPRLARLKAPHDRVLRLMEVPGRVLANRGVAAPHMPALQAQPQMHPLLTDLQALLAPPGVRLHVPDSSDMRAFHSDLSSQPGKFD
jgi:hypothetical protein